MSYYTSKLTIHCSNFSATVCRVVILFLSMIHRGDSSIKDAAIKAYNDVLKPYHDSDIQEACVTGLDTILSRSFVLLLIGETGES